MRLNLRKVWVAAMLASGFLVGCERAAVRPHPQDPLLVSKRPIEANAQESKPAELAYNEPAAPLLPATALASIPPNSNDASTDPERVRYRPDLVKIGAPVPASQYSAAESAPQSPPRDFAAPRTVQAIPAVRSGSAELPAVTAQRRQVSGPYGHNGDYTWLQGVLDKNYHGHFSLRFCDQTVQDRWGGKFHLVEDPRLDQFKEGDIVMVEGEIVQENGKPVLGVWNHYPVYRIRTVSLVQRKD